VKKKVGGLKTQEGSAIVAGNKGLTVRQNRFVAELAKGKSHKSAGESAGYARTSARKGQILKTPRVRKALESELEAQKLTTEYLVAKIRDLCEASDERESGRTAPNWLIRLKGVELLMRLLGVDRKAEAARPTFEEIVSRMWEDAQAFDPGIGVIDVQDSGGGNRTEIVVLKGQPG
jgi:hypothetical protein